jgi:diaminobutyrate acetyltransferase
MNIAYRIAVAEDAELLQSLAKAASPLGVHTVYSYWVLLRSYPGWSFIAIEQETGRPIGFVTSLPIERQERTAFVWQVGVVAERRRIGIGRRLLEMVKEVAVANGKQALEVTIEQGNSTSLTLFRRVAATWGATMEMTGQTNLGGMTGALGEEDVYRISLPNQHDHVMTAAADGHELSTLPVFVYGNLVQGETHRDEIEDAVRSSVPGRIHGRLYWHRSRRYPVCIVGGPSWVLGELIELKPVEAAHSLLMREELGYGYEARWVSVDIGGRTERALVFCWPWGQETLGALIPSGNYAAENEANH